MPDSVTVAGEPVASLVMVTEPVTLPAAVGANCTATVVFCEGDKLTGEFGAEKPVPVVLTCEMFTLELPVFVIVMVCAAELPVFTFPKLRLVGLTDRLFVAATPVPLKAIEVGEVGELLVIDMLPETAPAAAGTKVTVIVLCWPAFTLRGSEYPLSAKEVDPVCAT